jgi:hypothetical protein
MMISRLVSLTHPSCSQKEGKRVWYSKRRGHNNKRPRIRDEPCHERYHEMMIMQNRQTRVRLKIKGVVRSLFSFPRIPLFSFLRVSCLFAQLLAVLSFSCNFFLSSSSCHRSCCHSFLWINRWMNGIILSSSCTCLLSLIAWRRFPFHLCLKIVSLLFSKMKEGWERDASHSHFLFIFATQDEVYSHSRQKNKK